MRIIIMIVMVLLMGYLLSACGTNPKYVVVPADKPVLTEPSSKLTDPCSSPVTIPEKELTQLEVESMWSKDRESLVLCKDKHNGTVKYYKVRDAKLQGT